MARAEKQSQSEESKSSQPAAEAIDTNVGDRPEISKGPAQMTLEELIIECVSMSLKDKKQFPKAQSYVSIWFNAQNPDVDTRHDQAVNLRRECDMLRKIAEGLFMTAQDVTSGKL